MEIVFGLALLVTLGWWLYKAGKRTGSRKGYNVGIRKGRRQRRRK